MSRLVLFYVRKLSISIVQQVLFNPTLLSAPAKRQEDRGTPSSVRVLPAEFFWLIIRRRLRHSGLASAASSLRLNRWTGHSSKPTFQSKMQSMMSTLTASSAGRRALPESPCSTTPTLKRQAQRKATVTSSWCSVRPICTRLKKFRCVCSFQDEGEGLAYLRRPAILPLVVRCGQFLNLCC